MVAYNYSNTSIQTSLASGISSSSTVVALVSTAGLPASYPYTLLLDYGQANIEVVTVTGPSGANLTVTRGEDGTAAQAHNPGAIVVHGVAARDVKQPQDHMAASTGVHGATGAVVGTTDVQTLSGKTINGASNTLTVRDADITALSASKLTGNFNGGANFVAAADATVPITGTGTATATGNLLELYKGAARQLAVDPAGAVTISGGLAAGSALSVTRAVATDPAVQGKVTGDTNNRFQVQADGTLGWGPGNAAADASLNRSGAGVLAVTGKLTMSGTPSAATDVTTKNYVDARPVGPTVCTSTTRPGSPANPTFIYETDTKIQRVWDGSSWVMLTPWHQVQKLGAAAATVTFTVPSTLRVLRLNIVARTTVAAPFDNIDLRINGNSTAGDYRWNSRYSINAGAQNQGQNLSDNKILLGAVAAASSAGAHFGIIDATIDGWNNATAAVNTVSHAGYIDPGGGIINDGRGEFFPTGPYTTITLFSDGGGNLTLNSQFTLWGYE